jgi:hypothetical protein
MVLESNGHGVRITVTWVSQGCDRGAGGGSNAPVTTVMVMVLESNCYGVKELLLGGPHHCNKSVPTV